MNKTASFIALFIGTTFLITTQAEPLTVNQAEALIKNSQCGAGETVDSVLQKKTSSWQRDLGWQVFENDGSFAVEKSLLVSKSTQLRYRWQIDSQGKISAVTDRAKDLCGQTTAEN